MNLSFSEALLVVGLLVSLTAALSPWLRGTVLSISVLSVTTGIVLAALDVVEVDPGASIVLGIVQLALVVTLFSDGVLVERELLYHHWGPAARALVLAMPLTFGLLGLCAHALFALNWAEAFLLAAVLMPTDPVVTSSVVTSSRVPAKIRHTLNLESGLNDGLALPFVLFFIVLASPGGDATQEGAKLLGEAAVGGLIGLVLGYGGGKLVPLLPGDGLTRRYQGAYAFGMALTAYGLADVTFGNGLIAAFVAGIALALGEHTAPETFGRFSETVSGVLQVGTFFLFGALIVSIGFDAGAPELIVFILFALLIARPAAVMLSFVGERLPRVQKLFIAWFGPKGVASMLFALYVVNSQVPAGHLVFEIASFAILASIMAHGLTDTVGARWVVRRLEKQSQPQPD